MIFKQYYNPLVSYGYTLLKDREEAEDTVQQVFVNLWEKQYEIQIQQSLKSYLYSMVYHACLNKIKHNLIKERHRTYLGYQADFSYQPHVEHHELKQKIEQALTNLPPQCEKIFKLSRQEGLTYQQIADKMEISVKTVENQMGKALKRLREMLSDFLSLLPWLTILYFGR